MSRRRSPCSGFRNVDFGGWRCLQPHHPSQRQRGTFPSTRWQLASAGWPQLPASKPSLEIVAEADPATIQSAILTDQRRTDSTWSEVSYADCRLCSDDPGYRQISRQSSSLFPLRLHVGLSTTMRDAIFVFCFHLWFGHRGPGLGGAHP